jgi:hypothetical protein
MAMNERVIVGTVGDAIVGKTCVSAPRPGFGFLPSAYSRAGMALVEALAVLAEREELVRPVLEMLDYRQSGRDRIIDARSLRARHTTIGPARRLGMLTPRFLLIADDEPAWALDVAAPRGAIDDGDYHAGLYAYVSHRDVVVDWYAICDGRELALFHVADANPVPRVRASLERLGDSWHELEPALRPRGTISLRGSAQKDLGVHCRRLGLPLDAAFRVGGVRIREAVITRREDDAYELAASVVIDEQRYRASLELGRGVLKTWLGVMGSPLAIDGSFARGASVCVSAAADVRVTLEVRVRALVTDDLQRSLSLRVLQITR